MENAAVELGEGSLKRSGSDSPFGEIWLRVGWFAFPNAGWTDFVVVILGWWAEAAADALTGSSERHELVFMDGPFLATIRVVEDQIWHLDLVKRARERESVHSADVDGGSLSRSIAAASDQVLRRCIANRWISRDTERLETAVRRLKAALPRTPS